MDEIKGIRIVSLTGEKEYGIEDSEAREELANVVDGAPEELDSFKEAFEKFKEGGEALAGIAAEVAAVGKAVTAEADRAEKAEKALDDKIIAEADRAQQAEEELEVQIADEAARATAAVAAEKTRAEQVENTLDSKITTEAERALSAESAIEDAISEEAKATDEKIAKEKTRAETIEQALANDIANAPNLALRALFVAAGAEYNGSGVDKTKTAPWGETVTHKAGHYYLNGLGDITEKQMLAIYNRGAFNDSEKCPLGYSTSRLNQVRTNLCRIGMWNSSLLSYLCISNTTIEVVNLHIINKNATLDTCLISFSDSESLFYNALKLSVIDTRCLLSSSTWRNTAFQGCKQLKEVRIRSLKSNIVFKDSSLLSKATVLYMIKNAAPTTAITITLHADAYARLANDADIVAALAAQPLVTLVSA